MTTAELANDAFSQQLVAISSLRNQMLLEDFENAKGVAENSLIFLKQATPVGWSAEVVDAILAASASVPDDTQINLCNMPESNTFWWFEKPLDIPLYRDLRGVYGAMISVSRDDDGDLFLIGVYGKDEPCFGGKVFQAETLWWSTRETVDSISSIDRIDPGGAHYSDRLTAEESVSACKQFARFIVAAVAWLNTRYTAIDSVKPSRQIRRGFERAHGRTIDTIKIVRLRRPEHKATDGSSSVEWSHRWTVDGHWRNQPYGEKRGQRRLQWIDGYIKGPDDKPLVVKDVRFVANR